MKDRIRDIITDALEKAKVKFDTDGENIWVDDPNGIEPSISIGFIDCEPDESAPKKRRYTVSLHADVCDTFEMAAESPEEAEAIVKARVESCEIDIAKLEVNKVSVEAYEHEEN